MQPVQRCLLFVFVLAFGATAPAAEDVLTPQRVAELRLVTSAEISPDGARVAYTVSVPRRPGADPDGAPWTELWVWDWDQDVPRPFITGKVNIQQVRWTRDSRQIAFLAKRGDDKHDSLYLIPVDGGEARKAVGLASDITTFSLAPDGSRVALGAAEPEAEAKEKLRDKGFKQKIYEEQWRPVKIWIATLFGTETNREPLDMEGSVHQVHWSPVGDRLLLAVAPTPSVDDSYMAQRIRILDLASGDSATLNNVGKLGDIAWSPDGRSVSAIAAADLNDPAAGRLMVGDVSGGPLRDLLPGLEGHVSHVAWADDQTLLYVSGQGLQTPVGRVRFAGAGPESVFQLGGRILTSFSISKDGRRMASVCNSVQHPNELFTLEDGTSEPKRRTDSNPWLGKLRFGKQEPIRHKARDGLELEGVLIHPLDREDGKRYPLVLSVHGGPEAHISDGWLTSYSLPGQVAAARGMAVFYPNYRGSTGRGVAFSKLGQGDAAGKEFDDLVDAVDHLIGTGLVDRDRVGVTGGSYGGYATAWCSTRYSERFAAGVMFVGISDKISKVGTTDIPNEEYHVHALHRPWENWELLLQRSPIYHAGQGRTPLLIMHGEDDPRVNVGQSRELYRYLKLHNNVPVRLVLYPGEVHGNRKAGARLDYNLRMIQWMEHYLKGPGGNMPPPDIEYGMPEK